MNPINQQDPSSPTPRAEVLALLDAAPYDVDVPELAALHDALRAGGPIAETVLHDALWAAEDLAEEAEREVEHGGENRRDFNEEDLEHAQSLVAAVRNLVLVEAVAGAVRAGVAAAGISVSEGRVEEAVKVWGEGAGPFGARVTVASVLVVSQYDEARWTPFHRAFVAEIGRQGLWHDLVNGEMIGIWEPEAAAAG